MKAEDWRPGCSREMLARRAAALATARTFFAARDVLEVDTPAVVNAAVTDPQLHSARVQLGAGDDARTQYYLHTSPEYAMKRLLADGSGDIFQICHVVRGAERGRLHNPEFTLIEWYRVSWPLEALMDETVALVAALLGPAAPGAPAERLSYGEAFRQVLDVDPLSAPRALLAACARARGLEGGAAAAAGRDELLDFLLGSVIGPRLGAGRPCLLHGWPASQAALARLDPQDRRTARRFELYLDGVELANGFEELGDAGEQRARFEADRERRRRAGRACPAPDERLLAALDAGLPACSGVALGFDRVMMLASGARTIDAVMPFTIERA